LSAQQATWVGQRQRHPSLFGRLEHLVKTPARLGMSSNTSASSATWSALSRSLIVTRADRAAGPYVCASRALAWLLAS